jgi:hypothetical protein
MRPSSQDLSECYRFVTDVMGRINDQGGISIETAGHFKDLLHKLESYFIEKYKFEKGI